MGYKRQQIYNSTVHIYESSNKAFVKLSGSNSTSTLTNLAYDYDKTKYKEVCRINASLFDGSTVLGWDVSDVHNYRPTTSEGRFDVIAYTDKTFDIGDFVSSKITKEVDWAYSPSDILVQNGKEVDKFCSWRENIYKAKNPRTLFGIKADGSYVFVVVEGRSLTSAGITGYQAAQLMLNLGCIHAFNNDGGGSSQMNINGKHVNNLSDGSERRIVNGLFLFEPIEEEKEESDIEETVVLKTEIMRAPMNVVKITGSMQASSHIGTRSLDYAGINTKEEKVYAPCTLKIVKIDTAANTIFWESVNPVQTPTGTFYVCGTFGHDNYLNINCKVGNIIKQGEYMYDEGGKASGIINKLATHVHVRFGKGKFKDLGNQTYWYNVGNGNYEISAENGPLYHYDAFYICEGQSVVKYEDNPANEYPWIYYSNVKIIDVSSENKEVKFLKKTNIRNCPNLNAKIIDCGKINDQLKILEITEKTISGYYWVRTEKGWNALIEDATVLIEKNIESEKEIDNQIKELQKKLADLQKKNIELTTEISELRDKIVYEENKYLNLINSIKKLIEE